MNLVRSLMSFFLMTVLAVAVAGWIWAGDLPTAKQEGARVALALCALMSAGAVVLLWRTKDPASA